MIVVENGILECQWEGYFGVVLGIVVVVVDQCIWIVCGGDDVVGVGGFVQYGKVGGVVVIVVLQYCVVVGIGCVVFFVL